MKTRSSERASWSSVRTLTATVASPAYWWGGNADPCNSGTDRRCMGNAFGLIHPWSKYDLDHAILLVPKSLIHLGRVFEASGVSHYETRVYLSFLDFFE